MSTLANVLAIVAVIALVLSRQFRTTQVTAGGRWWLIPAVLAFLALRNYALVDTAHVGASAGLLVLELVAGGLMGVAWAWTTRMWTEGDGTVWAKGTKATALVWVGGILMRGAVVGLGFALGVALSIGGLMLSLALSLFVRAAVIRWRGERLRSEYGGAALAPQARPALTKETV